MKQQSGFTLVELMVTLAVAIVLLTVGIPVFSSMIANNRAAADSNALMTAFQLARGEAVKRGSRVSVCAGNGTAANTTPTGCSGDNDWRNGFLVVLNDTGTQGARTPAGDDILRVWARFKGEVAITDLANNAVSQVNYLPDGSYVPDAGGDASLGVCLHLQRSLAIGAQAERYLEITTQGRAWVVDKDDKAIDTVIGGPCAGEM